MILLSAFIVLAGIAGSAQADAAARARTAFEEAQRLEKEWWIGGHAERAAAKFREAASAWQAAEDRGGEARALVALGRFQISDLDDLPGGLDNSVRGLRLAREIGDAKVQADALNAIGWAHVRSFDDVKAIEFLSEAVRLFEAIRDDRAHARVLSRLGWAHLRLGQFDQVFKFVPQALAVSERIGDVGGQAIDLRRLGMAHLRLGSCEAALKHFERALPLALAARDFSEEALTAGGAARCLVRLGRSEEAIALHERGLAIWRRLGLRLNETSSLYQFALTHRRLGNTERALQLVESVLAIAEVRGRSLGSDDLRTSYQSRTDAYYDLYVDLLLGMHQTDPARGFDTRALEATERGRARGLVDLIEERRLLIDRGLPAEVKARERDLLARLSDVERRLLAARIADAPAAAIASIDAELAAADRERRQFEWEVRAGYRDYADVQYPSPPSLAEIRRLVPADAALVEYTLTSGRSAAFVVTSDALHTYPLPAAREIAELVRDFRASIERPGRRTLARYQQVAKRLYDRLLAPASAVLDSKRTLIVVPDGALNLLPFEALLTAESQSPTDQRALPYLVKRWTVAYAPSAGTLAVLQRRAQDAARRPLPSDVKELVAVAGADRTLPGADREVAAVAGRFRPNDVAVYTGRSAGEETFRRNGLVASARRLHFATHATIDEERPERSGLMLSPVGASTEDGFLRVYEIFNMQLTADLVVLSACETAMGKEVAGEGIIGLTRAFLYAGAASVTATLWPVADRSTTDFMVTFYDRLGAGSDKAKALQEAKRALVSTGRWAHPYYWAPFVLVGDAK